jgi:Uma2 family endonuclease
MRVRQPQAYRWTKAEYHRMADVGFFADQRVELIDGEIIHLPSPRPRECTSLACVNEALWRPFGEGFVNRLHAPLDLGPDSEPQPDLAVVPGHPRDYREHPTTALLVVEVSETTLDYDRIRKADLYAGAKIADYWIVNLVDRQLEVYRKPVVDSSVAMGFRYADVTVLGPADFVSPLAVPTARVAVADLLP